ncbi:alpha/beta fold hydrolase [Nocardioides marmoriginsengisoli]|uniref:Alpha/beta fold hydrolase n=1 Tax=Nocardioides marmoriginsengisoli TaxID=661483 RepID=A0A3N0CPL2_9ACTN|nr:alpha/beta fold hydrolase [Nocardioides marmoriginsengisoli]RNL65408.1 alpha/beta fold hydrolase [Nocardioides marmoriginsengisoli]
MPEASVVFVHGIFSSARAWAPMIDLVRSDPELADIVDCLAVDYPSPKFRLNPTRRIPDFNDLAEWLDNKLLSLDATRVILVGHSQGGLIIQRYLARLLDEGRAEELARVRAFLMFATPNNGSEAFLTLRKGGFFPAHAQERDLRPLTDTVAAAQARIMRGVLMATDLTPSTCPIDVRAHVAMEDNIVRAVSAKGMWPQTTTLPGDHKTIIRPTSASDDSFVALKTRLIEASKAPIPEPPVVGFTNLATSTEQHFQDRLHTDPPVQIAIGGGTVDFHVHSGPPERLAGLGAIVLSSNTYLAMSQFFKPSLSGRLRRAGAATSPSGEIVTDTIHDEITAWVTEHHRLGLTVLPGTVAPTSAGSLQPATAVRIYHAAIAEPVLETDDYAVNPHAVSAAVRATMKQARQDAEELDHFPRSVCFPLLGAGRGGLSPQESFKWIWPALEDELAQDPAWSIHFITKRLEDAVFLRTQLSGLAGHGD